MWLRCVRLRARPAQVSHGGWRWNMWMCSILPADAAASRALELRGHGSVQAAHIPRKGTAAEKGFTGGC